MYCMLLSNYNELTARPDAPLDPLGPGSPIAPGIPRCPGLPALPSDPSLPYYIHKYNQYPIHVWLLTRGPLDP